MGGGQADFYLAKLSPANYYRGKKIQVLLFDPGEGAKSIEILRPQAGPTPFVPMGFRYRTWVPGLKDAVTGNVYNSDPGIVSGPGETTLLVGDPASTLAANERAPWWSHHQPVNDFKYNGRLVSLEIQVPTGYGCVAGTIPCVEEPLPQDGWWKIRYNTETGVVSDRTTWSVSLLGDPVHLIGE